MARATSSLPVPVSPVTSTVASLSATQADHLLHPRASPALAPIRVSASSSGAAEVGGRRGGAQHPADEVGHLLAPDRLGQWSKAPSRIASMVLAALRRRSGSRPAAGRAARGCGAAPRARPSRPACGGRAGPRRRRAPASSRASAAGAVRGLDGRRGRGRSGSRPAPRAGPRRRRRSGCRAMAAPGRRWCRPAGRPRRAVPPCATATSRTIARPRPVPSGRPVTKGSNRLARIASGTPRPVSATSSSSGRPSRRARERDAARPPACSASRSAPGCRARVPTRSGSRTARRPGAASTPSVRPAAAACSRNSSARPARSGRNGRPGRAPARPADRAQQVAQQPIEAGDLAEHGVQRAFPPLRVARRQRVLGLQPHRRHRVADLVRHAGRDPAEAASRSFWPRPGPSGTAPAAPPPAARRPG